MKKLVWTGLVAVVTAVATAFALRGLRYAWTRIAKEEPPEAPWWARKFVGGPLGGTIKRSITPWSPP